MSETTVEELRRTEATMDLKWNKAEFLRLVKEVNHEMGFTDLQYTTAAVLALQQAAELALRKSFGTR